MVVHKLTKFFSNEAIALVVEETNRYASQCRSECSSPTQRPWHDITCDEIKAFFGMLFLRNMTWSDNTYLMLCL